MKPMRGVIGLGYFIKKRKIENLRHNGTEIPGKNNFNRNGNVVKYFLTVNPI